MLVTRRSLKRGRSGLRAKAQVSCVNWLNWIGRQTGAVLVMSSTWRHNYSLSEARALLRDQWFVRPYLAGMTPVLQWDWPPVGDCGPKLITPARGLEIKCWLDLAAQAGLEIESYVILDDDSDMLESQLGCFVQTDFERGLTRPLAQIAAQILRLPDSLPYTPPPQPELF